MALTNIEYGSVATSKVLNDNFNYLEDKIEDYSKNISTNNASLTALINSQTATISNNLNNETARLDSDIDKVEQSLAKTNTTITTLQNGVCSYMIPNYTKRTTLNTGQQYTASADGVVYVRVPIVSGNQTASISINNISFDLGSGLTNREGNHSNTMMFPVGKNDKYTITSGTDNGWFEAYFIPYKGKS